MHRLDATLGLGGGGLRLKGPFCIAGEEYWLLRLIERLSSVRVAIPYEGGGTSIFVACRFDRKSFQLSMPLCQLVREDEQEGMVPEAWTGH